MKSNLFFLFFYQIIIAINSQLFDEVPKEIKGEYDRFAQINSEPPSAKPNNLNVKDLILQAQNLIQKKGNPNILEPPKPDLEHFANSPSFLSQNPENKENINNKQKNQDNENENIRTNNNVFIDGEKYELDEIKEIIEFNKKLVKLCKIDFSNCFDIKKAILPKKKVLSLLVDDKNEENAKIEIKPDEDNYDYEVNQKIEDDLIDLGLK